MINSTKNHYRSIQNERKKNILSSHIHILFRRQKRKKKYRSFEVADYDYAEYDNKVQRLIRIESVEVKKGDKEPYLRFSF